ncbi:MAG TPA: ABC transporter permease [Lachnospiraceae bacterium]|nr:ABC transporter permease [Lachnospiraceae bacterium]
MNLIDLLRMSSANLKRRKLRTFLTVLGVIIGTASIVVMISLGLGMQEAMYAQVEEYGGLTSIDVTGMNSYGGGYYFEDSEQSDPAKYLTDDTLEELKGISHIEAAVPRLTAEALLLKGKYQGWVTLIGLTPEGFAREKIELAEGSSLPDPKAGELQMVFGNGIITNMYDKNGGGGYWETGEYPDIDFMNDTVFYILDTDAYYQTQGNSGMMGENGEQVKPPKKHIVSASGMVDGTPDDYNMHYYDVYCDLETLKTMLKKEFRGKVIPGQPSTSSGKPYNYLVYSSVKVYVDELDNVDGVQEAIRALGYNTSSNIEYMESMKSQFAIIQAVLGGIGAVSLFVAAIGIANTMMMSIYERTKEIGVIKVLGCDLKNIKQMFLMEAAFIGLLGGVIGNVLSYLISFVINRIVSAEAILGVDGSISYIPPWLALASMGFAVLVGMAAGYFPALRAMRLSPLAAIRNE